jgi:hypothetical protein
MNRSLFIALLVPLALIGCAAETTPDETNDSENVAETQSELTIGVKPTPFCLPGEVRKCTLGPPPVCRCEPLPVGPVIVGSYSR